jgi:hypothetical protein
VLPAQTSLNGIIPSKARFLQKTRVFSILAVFRCPDVPKGTRFVPRRVRFVTKRVRFVIKRIRLVPKGVRFVTKG